MKNKKTRHIIAMGFAMFAAWFGAGNLIFPPYLGNIAGNQWLIGFIGFFVMDVGLALLSALMAIGNRRGNVSGMVARIGRPRHRDGQFDHDLYWAWPGDSKMCCHHV